MGAREERSGVDGYSAPVYISLEIATWSHFGFTAAAAVTQRHRDLQARSGDEIMQGLYELGGGRGGLRYELTEVSGVRSDDRFRERHDRGARGA